MSVVERFKKIMLSQMEHLETEPEIRNTAEILRETPLFYGIEDEEFESVVKLAVDTLNISFGESHVVESDEKLIPWFESYYKELGVTRWDRYTDYLQNNKKFPVATINSMQENLFKITDLLGNPNGENFKRKGLIVGDVQSGKTANYVGLMNLATDAKYKLMIVLTGTTNTLREQTQLRIEDGLGKRANKPKGVSAIKNSDYNDMMPPVYLTSFTDDFTKSAGKTLALSLEQTKTPIVIVTKKNSNSLRNIYEWLEEYSKINNHDHIDSSLLLIDDEADFASVNTKKDEDSPTAINSRIRNILELFTRSSYIGFTATPFANIFIDHETDDDMFGQDLFPRDYIYVLGESSEYVGVQQVFSDQNEFSRTLIRLNKSQVNDYLELKHKKDAPFNNLPPSLKNAINLFFLANVIRDLRNDKTQHRSMMINISRFSDMHEKIKSIVLSRVNYMTKEIRLNSKLPYKEALANKVISELRDSFNQEYTDLEEGYTFKEILEQLNDSTHNITVGIINMHHKEIDYLNNDDHGLRVIVIGGFALSRGLTLEGLIISYYWRNSVMYDSLLQMGRWFGYRPNYRDLVRIFMTEEVISDFRFIAVATNELKNDLEFYSQRGSTPKDFGIRIRSGQTGLIITSRNKMRTGVSKITAANFNHDIVETLALTIEDDSLNKDNILLISEFIDTHKELLSNNLNPSKPGKTKGLVNIDKVHIIEFLKKYKAVLGSKFDNHLIIKWLIENNSPILEKWDIVFIEGEDSNLRYDYGNQVVGYGSSRTMIPSEERKGLYLSTRSRLGSPSDGRMGLNKDQHDIVKALYKSTIPQKNYFDAVVKRKPLLAIYSVQPKEANNDLSKYLIPLISLGIPELGPKESKYVNYTINKVYQMQMIEEEEMTEE